MFRSSVSDDAVFRPRRPTRGEAVHLNLDVHYPPPLSLSEIIPLDFAAQIHALEFAHHPGACSQALALLIARRCISLRRLILASSFPRSEALPFCRLVMGCCAVCEIVIECAPVGGHAEFFNSLVSCEVKSLTLPYSHLARNSLRGFLCRDTLTHLTLTGIERGLDATSTLKPLENCARLTSLTLMRCAFKDRAPTLTGVHASLTRLSFTDCAFSWSEPGFNWAFLAGSGIRTLHFSGCSFRGGWGAFSRALDLRVAESGVDELSLVDCDFREDQLGGGI